MENLVRTLRIIAAVAVLALFISCNRSNSEEQKDPSPRHHVIFDTDANNEVDDQHALAYLLFNGDFFNVVGVTVNATSSPEGFSNESHVDEHFEEAQRVMHLCGDLHESVPLLRGANGSFVEIEDEVSKKDFDGQPAVDFIIEEALKKRESDLILLAVGKLTNVALALKKEPSIAENMRVVWLGANYPEAGEHNLVWDIESMNFILDFDVPFEIVTVRYGDPSGTSAVRATQAQMLHRMPGAGPVISEYVTGRHGDEFNNWGDYSANLFEKYEMHGEPLGRSLFDMAAVAIVKNPDWAESKEIPAPLYVDGEWVDRPDNSREITIWEWFDIYGIMNDYFQTMNNYKLVE